MDDELWFIPISVRSSKIADVTGGWSHMLTRFLDIFLWSDNGIATAGVALTLAGSPYLLKANLRVCLADGEGLMKALEWRGAPDRKSTRLNSSHP